MLILLGFFLLSKWPLKSASENGTGLRSPQSWSSFFKKNKHCLYKVSTKIILIIAKKFEICFSPVYFPAIF